MKGSPNVNYIVQNTLCTGCGVCQDACPQNAIHFEVKNGLNTPFIDKKNCINDKGCSRCYDICPGKGLEILKEGEELFAENATKYDYYLGYYHSCFSGFSQDYDIRYHSAAGGLLSQFLIYLLEKRIISGAVVTGFDKSDPMKPYPFIATTKEEILRAKSSKYCPVSLNGIATQLTERKGKFIIVGLPCHIHGFRNFEKKNKKFKSKIFGYFAIYCSSNQNFYAQGHICKKYNIERNNLKSFTYRDDGCLGFLKAEHINNRIVKIPYRRYYHSLRSFFKPKRCLSCVDHYGELADVCFGDIQVGEYKNDKIGVNSLIVRNKEFEQLLNSAEKEGYISLNEISKEVLNESQKIMLRHKREVSKSVMFFDKLLLRKAPDYDIKLKGHVTVKSLFSVFLTHIQRTIGRNKQFWFVIDWFSKN